MFVRSVYFRICDNTCNGHRAGCVLWRWSGSQLLVVKVSEAVQTSPVNQSEVSINSISQSEASITCAPAPAWSSHQGLRSPEEQDYWGYQTRAWQ